MNNLILNGIIQSIRRWKRYNIILNIVSYGELQNIWTKYYIQGYKFNLDQYLYEKR